MASIAYDLIYLRAALENLESYLLSPEIFWNLPAKPPPGELTFPALTLGGILLARQRLERRSMPLADQATYRELCLQLDVLRNRWRTAWEKKAAQSFHARLTQWGNFLEDYRQEPRNNLDRYPYEARLRVMLQLLDQGNPFIPPEERELLASLDALLFIRLTPAPFIWEAEYQPSFPQAQYPYLYGRLIPDDGQPG